MTTSDKQAQEGLELRDRIERYLHENGLNVAATRVVRLTGDASDRRYFRVIHAEGHSVVLALHAGPIEFVSLPFANVAELLQRISAAGAGASGSFRPTRDRRARRPGRCDAPGTSGRGAATEHAALSIARPFPLSSSCSAGARNSIRMGIFRYKVSSRRRQADLGARVLREALPGGYRGSR